MMCVCKSCVMCHVSSDVCLCVKERAREGWGKERGKASLCACVPGVCASRVCSSVCVCARVCVRVCVRAYVCVHAWVHACVERQSMYIHIHMHL
jgi:hypothetical protein